MTERDIPESWSSASGREPDQNTRLSRTEEFGETQPFDVPATGSTSKSVKRRKKNDPDRKASRREGGKRSHPQAPVIIMADT